MKDKQIDELKEEKKEIYKRLKGFRHETECKEAYEYDMQELIDHLFDDKSKLNKKK